MYCENCEHLVHYNKNIVYKEHCKKYNVTLNSERLTDSITMRDELCVYKCDECKRK